MGIETGKETFQRLLDKKASIDEVVSLLETPPEHWTLEDRMDFLGRALSVAVVNMGRGRYG